MKDLTDASDLARLQAREQGALEVVHRRRILFYKRAGDTKRDFRQAWFVVCMVERQSVGVVDDVGSVSGRTRGLFEAAPLL
jgi:hypothetical protein